MFGAVDTLRGRALAQHVGSQVWSPAPKRKEGRKEKERREGTNKQQEK